MLVFGSTTLVYAQKDGFKRVADPKPVEDKLVAASRTVTTIMCDFIQEKHLDYLSTEIKSKGKFWFKKPSVLRWEYTDPFNYLVIINNGKITIKDEGKKNQFDVKSNQVFKELNDIMINSMNGSLIESPKYQVELFENKDQWMVRLTPKDGQMKKILSFMELYFLKSDLTVDHIKMIETDKDYTLIRLLNKKFNTQVQNSVFEVR